jgi:type IV pilus assembly protein PilF
MKAKLIRSASIVATLMLAIAAHAADKSPQGEADLAHNTGTAYINQGRYDLAIEQFNKALKVDSKYYYAYKGLGIAYQNMQKYKEAEKAQRKCLEINPDFGDVHNDLGVTLMLMGRRDEARSEWLVAYNSPFNPSPDKTAWNLGNSYFNEGNLEQAGHWYQEALQKDPKSGPANTAMASTLVAQGRVDEAITLLQKAVGTGKTATDDPDLLVALCEGYYKAGRFAEARPQCDAAIKKNIATPAAKHASELLKQFPK